MKRLIFTTIILLSVSIFTACKKEKDEPDPQPKISQNALMAYWKLDESSGTNAQDETGNWNLSFVSSPSWSSPGKINRSIEFGTASAQYLEKTGVSSGNQNAYTLAAWIFPTAGIGEAQNIMGMNSGVNAIDAGAAEVKLYLTADYRLVASYHTVDGWTGPMLRISGNSVAPDTWTHVVGVINNGNIELYINGAVENQNTLQNTPVTSALNFSNGRVTIGNARLYNGSYIANRWFRGKIDEVAIWSRALSLSEISALYNNGGGLQYPFQ